MSCPSARFSLTGPSIHDLDALLRRGQILAKTGNVFFASGYLRTAIKYYELALFVFHQLGKQSAECTLATNLGNAYVDLGEPDRALQYYQIAMNLYQQICNYDREQESLYNMGVSWL
ncbi:MAG: tetratricopeptide repeat protein [Acidobacteriota bacterium]